MAIHVDVYADLHERDLRRQTDALKRELEQAGDSAGRGFSSKIERAYRDIERANLGVSKSFDAVRTKNESVKKSLENTTVAGRNWIRVRQEMRKANEDVARTEQRLSELLQSEERDERAVARATEDHTRAKENHQRVTARLIDSATKLRQARVSGTQAERSAASADRDSAAARRTITRAHEEFNRVLGDGVSHLRSHQAELNRSSGVLSRVGDGIEQNVAGLTGLGRVGLPVIAALAVGIEALGGVAAYTAQAVYLLPAAAAAAGAAFGTLQLATAGFANTIQDIRDPKKFAEDIQSLSPAAQQTALSIQALLPQFDNLKNATQDAFFSGFAGQLEQLTTTYLPSVQNLTTSIASSFNKMALSVTDNLMTPENQANIQTIFDNISTMFQNLTPAAQAFSQALLDITTVGSGFLPDIGSTVAGLARDFADFIREARDSGQLKEWMSGGLDALKQLGGLALTLVEDFMELAPVGERVLPLMVTSIEAIAAGLDWWIENTTKFSPWLWVLEHIGHLIDNIRDAFLDIPEAFSTAVNAVVDGANGIADAIANLMILPAKTFLELWNAIPLVPDVPIPNIDVPNIPHMGPGGDWSGHRADPGATQSQRSSDRQRAPMAGPLAAGPVRPDPNRPVPAKPAGSGGTPSDRERRDAIIAGLDPSLWKVDPYAQVPGLPPGQASVPKPGTPGAPAGPNNGQYGLPDSIFGIPIGGGQTGAGGAAPGGYRVDPQQVLESQHAVESAAHDLEESRKDRLALERDNQATAEQISDARWKETEAGWKLQKEQSNLADAQRGTYDKMSKASQGLASGMGEIGASLDQDLGISKGLSGIAENLTKFLANLAFAPMLGALSAVSAASPSQGGSGIIGMMGAAGAFGPQFTGLQQGTAGAYATQPGMQYGQSGSQYGGDAALLAHVPAGTYNASGDLAQGLGDCSSAVEDLVNIMDGRSTAGRSMSTGNAPEWLTQHGFLPGSMPGAFNVGFNSGHMQATLPGGTPFNWGSDAAAARGGVGGSGASDPSFTSRYYRPVGGGASMPMPAIAPSAAGAAVPGADWNTIAQREAGGNWATNTGNGYSGGLQFAPSSWAGAGGTQYAPAAWQATPEQQIATAENLLAQQGPGAWPNTFAPYTGPPGAGGPGRSRGGPPGPGQVNDVSKQLDPTRMPWSPSPGPATPAQKYGGVEPYSNPQGGQAGITSGGTLDTAINLAATAFPGVGQAAATGVKLANRAIQYGGQVAGIMTQGALDTFLPWGGSELASNNWLTRIVGGLAGASPQLPNVAGSMGEQTGPMQPGVPGGAPPPVTPQMVAGADSKAPPPPGPNIKVEYNNNNAPEDRAGKDLTYHLGQAYTPPGRKGG